MLKSNKMMNRIPFLLFFILLQGNTIYGQKKFLFDATKAETAGNADWVIDQDNGIPQRFPTPSQNTVTEATPENYWLGGISSWGIALVKLGYQVETLPSGSKITYNDPTNVQDLSKYAVYVIVEPNTPFTSIEKKAILNFVYNGGGLFLISDHAGADRNNDNWDAVRVLNDLFRDNGLKVNPFGIMVDSVTFSETSSNRSNQFPKIIDGQNGSVSQLKFSSGASLTLDTIANNSVQGVFWKASSIQHNLHVMAAASLYGNGRVFVLGDSSPADDGTGAAGNTLYPGWTEVNGNHARLHMNASQWLVDKLTSIDNINTEYPYNFALQQNYPNPFNPSTKISYYLPFASPVSIKVFNTLGTEVITLVKTEQAAGEHEIVFDGSTLPSGVYVYSLNTGNRIISKKMILTK